MKSIKKGKKKKKDRGTYFVSCGGRKKIQELLSFLDPKITVQFFRLQAFLYIYIKCFKTGYTGHL